MVLADRVKQQRERLGLSQEELARRMGYSSRTSINKIENGRPCSQKIIARLADALDTTIPYLMGWDEEKATVHDDGLTENKRLLMQFVDSVPEDKAAKVLRLMQAILEDD